MKCQNLFSGKNKKNIINLPSAKFAQRVVKVNKYKNPLLQMDFPFCKNHHENIPI